MFNKPPLITTFFLLFIPLSFIAQGTISATYNISDIPTSFNVYDANCNGPSTTLSVTLPVGENFPVTSVDVVYSMTSLGTAWKSSQRSKIRFANNGSEESEVSGSGQESGVQNYSRSIDIANGVYPGGTELVFEMWVKRTFEGTEPGCNTSVARVNAFSWTITVHYGEEQPFPKVGVSQQNPEATLDVGGKIKIGDDAIAPQAGMIRWNSDTKNFEGYNGTEWIIFSNQVLNTGWGYTTTPESYVLNFSGTTGSGGSGLMGYSLDTDGTKVIGGTNPNSDKKGRAYIFDLVEGVWEPVSLSVPSELSTGDNFGLDVAIDGNDAAIGAPAFEIEFNSKYGAVYTYQFNGNSWTRNDTIYAQTGSTIGSAIDIKNNVLIIGVNNLDIGNKIDVGGALLFEKVNNKWEIFDTLVNPFGQSYDRLGDMVGISQNIAVVNRRFDPYIFVYRKINGDWQFLDSITVTNAPNTFGDVLSVDEFNFAVGKGNAVYQYTVDINNNIILEGIIDKPASALNTLFGESIFLSGDEMIIGSKDAGPGSKGMAYIYKKSNNQWNLEAQLYSDTGADFGISTVLTTDAALVGSSSGVFGQIYIFKRTD